jgi:pyrroline-5-carboxylate reductase
MRRSASDPATLRQNVTSPGGTTAAALSVLMRDKDSLQELMTEAVLAAQKRGRELGS